MAFLHRLLKCWRNGNTTVASASSFLVLLLVFSVLLAAMP